MNRRSPLKQKKPWRRREGPTADRLEHARARSARIARQVPPPTAHRGVMTGTTRAQPKGETLQHDGYIRVVRAFGCEHCGRPGPSEFAHADTGKGAGTKSDCRMGTSLCRFRSPEDPGCHWLIGTKRIYPKAKRREIEAQLAARTRAKVRAAGTWPKALPPWPGDTS